MLDIIYKSMLGRLTKESSYRDTKISSDFSNFKTWYEKQHIDYQLDKDLLSLGSNIYSVYLLLMNAINFVRVKRGGLLLGVSRNHTTFRTSGTRHQKNFSSEIEALSTKEA